MNIVKLKKAAYGLLPLLALLFVASLSTHSLAASMRFDLSSSSRQLNHVFIAQSNMVFKVNPFGELDGIWKFPNSSGAQRFLDYQRRPHLHSNKLPFLRGGSSPNTTRLYTVRPLNRQNITYYRSAYDKHDGFYDAVKSFNGISVEYFRNKQHNKRYGLVGKVKRIGSVAINYYYGTGRDKGKVRSIGSKTFQYEPYSSSGKAAGYVGKLMSIGGVPIKYFEAYSTNKGYQGKIKSIGNVSVKYLNNFNIPHPPKDKFGQFDKLIGSDSRFTLFVR